MNTNKKEVHISESIYLEIDKRAKSTGFCSINEYIEYVLQQIIEKSRQKEVKINSEQEKGVAEELKKAGYIE